MAFFIWCEIVCVECASSTAGRLVTKLTPPRPQRRCAVSEKFVSPCPPPTAYERELLEILIEECAEVQQRATKALRFGLAEVQPGQMLNNAQRMAEEYGDLLETVRRCRFAGLMPRDNVIVGMERKRRQLDKYMQHAPEATPADTEGR